MKIILAILFSAFSVQAQMPQVLFVRTPVQIVDGKIFVDCPYFPPVTAVTNDVYVTNYVYTTITNLAPRPMVQMTNNVVSSPGLRTDYFTFIVSPTNFVMGPLQVGNDVIVHVFNNQSNQIAWPTNLKLPNGPLPTNSARCWIWFRNVNGEVWASP